jgi:hypothetical protein
MNLDILQSSEATEEKALEEARPESSPPGSEHSEQDHSGPERPASLQPGSEAVSGKWIWNPDGFAREQLRGLVQRIFFSQSASRMRQVVISAAESRTDISGICRQVGEILSEETSASVVVVAGHRSGSVGGVSAGLSAGLSDGEERLPARPRRDALATRVRGNLWLTAGLRRKDAAGDATGDVKTNVHRGMISSTAWYARLCEFRREFEYSILEGPAAGESSDSAIAAQVADGMILVLTAHGTRRATVQRIQETLKSTQTHLLGTILAERRFPIPQGIYRRL